MHRNPKRLIAASATKLSPKISTNLCSHASGVKCHWHSLILSAAALNAALPSARRSRRLTKKKENSLLTSDRSAPDRVRCFSTRVVNSKTRGITR